MGAVPYSSRLREQRSNSNSCSSSSSAGYHPNSDLVSDSVYPTRSAIALASNEIHPGSPRRNPDIRALKLTNHAIRIRSTHRVSASYTGNVTRRLVPHPRLPGSLRNRDSSFVRAEYNRGGIHSTSQRQHHWRPSLATSIESSRRLNTFDDM